MLHLHVCITWDFNFRQIYAATKDDNFDLLFVDYESTDINLKETIESSSFKR